MKSILIDGLRYRIVFQYPHKHSKRRRRVKVLIRRTTEDGQEEMVLISGEATCNLEAGDKFDKKQGMKLALDMAMLDVVSRSVRTALWGVFWGRFPQKGNKV